MLPDTDPIDDVLDKFQTIVKALGRHNLMPTDGFLNKFMPDQTGAGVHAMFILASNDAKDETLIDVIGFGNPRVTVEMLTIYLSRYPDVLAHILQGIEIINSNKQL